MDEALERLNRVETRLNEFIDRLKAKEQRLFELEDEILKLKGYDPERLAQLRRKPAKTSDAKPVLRTREPKGAKPGRP